MSNSVVICWGCKIDPGWYEATYDIFNIRNKDLAEISTKINNVSEDVHSTFAIKNSNYKICLYQTAYYEYIAYLELDSITLDLRNNADDSGIIPYPSKEDINKFNEFIKEFQGMEELTQYYIVITRNDGGDYSD